MTRAGIDTPGLCFTVGCPGVGKTTWAQANKADDTLVVELDQMRIALFGGKQEYFDHPVERRIKSNVINGACFGAMRQWEPNKFIISNTNIMPQFALPYLQFASARRLSIHVVVFDAPLDLVIYRNHVRPVVDRVPDATLREMYDNMHTPENQWWETFKGVSNFERIALSLEEAA